LRPGKFEEQSCVSALFSLPSFFSCLGPERRFCEGNRDKIRRQRRHDLPDAASVTREAVVDLPDGESTIVFTARHTRQ